MVNPINTTVGSGWKADVTELAEASEMEFLKWFYLNTDSVTRKALETEFQIVEKKALPKSLRR